MCVYRAGTGQEQNDLLDFQSGNRAHVTLQWGCFSAR